MKWQPIETAKEAGTFDLWVIDKHGEGYRLPDCQYWPHLKEWRQSDNDPVGDAIIPLTITHWMPLPEPPE